MPKVSKYSRSPLQERIIVAAMFIETLIGQGGLFSDKAINQVLGGRLTKYRKAEIDRMAKNKWFESHTPLGNGQVFYRLTIAARSSVLADYKIEENDYITPDEFLIWTGENE